MAKHSNQELADGYVNIGVAYIKCDFLTKYSNKELADDYVRVVFSQTETSSVLKRYIKVYNLLRNFPINIKNFYLEHGSLKDLNIKGISKTTKSGLETILKYGAERAEKFLERKRNLKGYFDIIPFDEIFQQESNRSDMADFAGIEIPNHDEESFP